MRHTLSILVENRLGELARIVGLLSARGYNIESLTVAETLDPAVSRVTLVTKGEDKTVEQVTKQLSKQVRVLEVANLTGQPHVERELVLINVRTEGDALHSVLNLVSANRLKVVEVSDDNLIIEATGEWDKMSELIEQLAPLGIRGLVRTGAVALAKDSEPSWAATGEGQQLLAQHRRL